MAYPTKPSLSTSYTAVEQSLGDGSFPGQELDVDLVALKAAIEGVIDFIQGVTRSDGKLANQSVSRETLAEDILLGFDAPSAWESGRSYIVPNTVFFDSVFYVCAVDHTAGLDFATDLASGRWVALVDFGAETTEAQAAAAAASTSAGNAATSATNAAASAAAAAASEGEAAGSANLAADWAEKADGADVNGVGTRSARHHANASATSATAASNSASAAAASLDEFDDRYLGAKASDPTLDNDGNPLITGALYFNTAAGVMRVYDGSAWSAAYVPTSGLLQASNNLSDVASAPAARSNLGLGSTGPLSNRNKIINGAMVIDQRNGGASVAVPVGTSQIFPLDRWRCQNNGGTSAYSAQRVAEGPAGFQNSLKITTTTAAAVTAADRKHMWLPIEGFDVADFGFGTADAQDVTLSFWARSSVTGNHGAALSNSGAARAYAFLYNIAQANTWEYKTVTIPGDTAGTWLKANGQGLRVNFNIGSGSDYIVAPGAWGAGPDRGAIGQVSVLATAGATWQITGVQLEAGDTATPFEHRSYGQELALCQRYYFSINPAASASCIAFGSASQTTTVFVGFSFPVEMRSAPSYSSSGSLSNYNLSDGNSGVAVSDTALQSATNKFARVQFTPASSLTQFRPYWVEPQNDTTTLNFSAEL